MDEEELSVVLDGANLLLSSREPRFEVLTECMDAVSGLVGHCLGHTVIDQSLLSRCDRRTRHDLELASARGDLSVAPDADPVMLGLAEDRDVLVVSADKFRGWQRAFPFLVGNERNFLEPVFSAAGRIAIRRRPLPLLDEAEISMHEERDALKAGRLRDDHGALTATLVCENTNCPASNKPPGTALPRRVRTDVYECFECQVPMRHVGRRRPAVGLVVNGPGGDARFWVPYGQQMMLGRSAVAGSVRLADLAGPALSRKHVLVRIDEQGVSVRDLGSTNGTEIFTADGARTPLEPGISALLDVHARLDLGGALTVRRSGRTYPFDFDAVISKSSVRDIGGKDATERRL